MEVDAFRNPGLMRFMNELAAAAARALARPHATLTPPGTNGEARLPEAQRYLALVEREFSCQVCLCLGPPVADINSLFAVGGKQHTICLAAGAVHGLENDCLPCVEYLSCRLL